MLIQLALISEGSAQQWEPGHGQPGSRPPGAVIERPQEGPPPKERSLYDYWRWRFDHARSDEVLAWLVELAESDLRRARKAPPAVPEIGEERRRRILAVKGSPEHVAARMRLNISHVRTLRQDNDQDPETGEQLPDDRDARLERARAMIAIEGKSEREAARRCGVPRSTLQRILHGSE